MSRTKKKGVRSFSIDEDTLDEIRTVATKANLSGGSSALVQDACQMWLKRYKADPKRFVADRGIAHTTEAADDL